MARAGEERADRAAFDDPARIHHGDAVGDLRDHAKIVRDEKDAHSQFCLKVADQRQDLTLDGDVQRGGGLVRDQERG